MNHPVSFDPIAIHIHIQLPGFSFPRIKINDTQNYLDRLNKIIFTDSERENDTKNAPFRSISSALEGSAGARTIFCNNRTHTSRSVCMKQYRARGISAAGARRELPNFSARGPAH
jgi:hypothetical protein